MTPEVVILFLLVALLGLMGGGLSGALAIRHLQGSSTPYDVPVALSLLKLPSGALLALVGLLFVRGGFVPGLSQLDSQPQILASSRRSARRLRRIRPGGAAR